MSNLTFTPEPASALSTRTEALNSVVSGLNSIRDGLIAYHSLGLTPSDLYADLKSAGWEKSKRTLQRIATELREEQLLPEAPARGTHAVRAKMAQKEQEEPQPIDISAVVVEEEQSLEDQLKTIYNTYEKLVLKNRQAIKEDPNLLSIAKWISSLNQSYLNLQ